MAGGNLPVLNPIWSKEFFQYTGPGIDNAAALANDIWNSANRIVYYPFQVGATFTIRRFFIVCNAPTAGATGRVGVYSAAGAKLVESNGTIDLATAGADTIRATNPAAPYELAAGTLYYLAMTASSTSFTGVSTGALNIVSYLALGGAKMEAGSGTLPSTATMVANTDAVIWSCGISSSATVPL